MRNTKIKEMVTLALFISLLFVMTFVPNLGYIMVPPLSFTTLHIVVIIAGFAFGLKYALFTSFIFGLTSFIKAINAANIGDQLFANPLLAILPRLVFGLFVGLIGEFFLNRYKDDKKKFIIYSGIGAIITTVIHTVAVLFSVSLVDPSKIGGEALAAIYKTVFSLNGAFEVGTAFVLVPLISVRIMNYLPHKKINKNQEGNINMTYKTFAKDTLPILLNTLKEWINIPSVYDENTITKEMPFGKDVSDALNYIADKARQDGFEVDTCDGYATEISFGQGEELIMVLGHCDVVPVGTGWDRDPFLGEVINGEVYGRGSGDDKGPSLCAYYALKYIKDNYQNINKRYRLVIGGNEERGSACLHYYFNTLKKEHPTYGFTPDADFPVVYGEKGIMNYIYEGNCDDKIISFEGGVAANSVPDLARVVIKGKLGVNQEFNNFLKENNLTGEYEENENTIITMHGKLAHGAMPYLGVNAIVYLLNFLANYLDIEFVKYYANALSDCYGKNLDIAIDGEKMGKLTMNVGLAHIENGKYSFTLNLRYPIDISGEELIAKLNKASFNEGKCISDSKPLYVDPNSDFIQALMTAYVNNTGDTTSKPITIGGGTYARETINSVAFGMGFPGQDELAHQANERISVDNLEKGLAIYLEALTLLGEL